MDETDDIFENVLNFNIFITTSLYLYEGGACLGNEFLNKHYFYGSTFLKRNLVLTQGFTCLGRKHKQELGIMSIHDVYKADLE